MLYTTAMILDTLEGYSSPRCRLQRLVEHGEFIYLKRGLYESDRTTPGFALASALYNPSYLSFDYALAFYGMIPETVFVYTSATCSKNRTKLFENSFGRFSYRDVPTPVFIEGLDLLNVKEGYTVWIANREKALCDKLYDLPPIEKIESTEELLFDDLRIDEDEFSQLDAGFVHRIAEKYRCRNVRRLDAYLQ